MARFTARIDPPWSYDAWRTAARRALQADVPPQDIDWSESDVPALLDAPDITTASDGTHARVPLPRVPRAFVELAASVLCHREPQRLPLLHRLLWRIGGGERGLLSNPADADVQRAFAMAQSVRRDAHKMKAFVRFREVPGETDAFIAWFEPEHRIVDRVAPFFARRFAGMRWAILTPYRSAYWDGEALAFGPGATRADAPTEDAREDLWRTYYAHIFNPARLNTRMMRQEMAVKYWKHLPEAALLPTLVREAPMRVREMQEREAQQPKRRIPERAAPATPSVEADSLDAVRAQARDCRACPLWEPATQTVFGEGPPDARIMFVGEQPGDQEDLTGRPFVGPAGQLLDRALHEAGIDRAACYMTNAVKHFRFEQRGKFRLHRNPAVAHVKACRPWLAREIEQVRPDVIVCLGASAAQAVLGSGFKLMAERGQWRTLHDGTRAMATVHPSWVLRQGDGAAREAAYRGLVGDLALLQEHGVAR
jgi:probable DNA metabolism protein